MKGEKGAMGIKLIGPQGEKGEPGPQGPPGVPAVAGSEAQTLLVGPPGPPGMSGDPGMKVRFFTSLRVFSVTHSFMLINFHSFLLTEEDSFEYYHFSLSAFPIWAW